MSMSHHLSNTTEFIFDSLEDLVPKNHLVRKLEASIDWGFIYGLVKHIYNPGGRPGIDPVILFKMLFINIESDAGDIFFLEIVILVIYKRLRVPEILVLK